MLQPRPAALAAMAFAVAAGGALAITDALAALERVRGLEAAQGAEGLVPGIARDDALNSAQFHLRQALDSRAHDAAAWLALAHVRFLQATADVTGAPSPILLADAADAAAHAARIAPRDAEAPARLALALSFIPERRAEAMQALAHSYALSATEPGFARVRIEAGARAWTQAPLDLRARISDEVCVLGAEGDASVFDLGVQAGDPMAAASFEALRLAPRCAPPRPLP